MEYLITVLLVYAAGVCVTGLIICIGERLHGGKLENWDNDDFMFFSFISFLSWFGLIGLICLMLGYFICCVVSIDGIKTCLLKERSVLKYFKELVGNNS